MYLGAIELLLIVAVPFFLFRHYIKPVSASQNGLRWALSVSGAPLANGISQHGLTGEGFIIGLIGIAGLAILAFPWGFMTYTIANRSKTNP